MNIGIIGSGIVAQTLAAGFEKHGYQVKLGTRNPAQLDKFVTDNPSIQVGSFADAAEYAELVVLAVKGSVAESALEMAGAENLSGKTLIDANNPISDEPPVNGVLQFFTEQNDSLMERLQSRFPETNFVKAFSSVGSAMMVNPQYSQGRPSMFICGNNNDAKKQVGKILDQFGWEIEDMGSVEAARAIEPLCMLWCIKGFNQNHWTHAFKLLN
ncbi:DNA-binding protein [Aliikangiella marina]|uniref:DNA-binding protein n=1 Tax=Aliikangiella marina TaxID=1712262 RepID=A0A545TC47_9GAMM|nr:NAD(P)-binding domain-containing protein [Aliikangiella marina]TQV74792.1 DNA-binding protein [Aliikangiella marina]